MPNMGREILADAEALGPDWDGFNGGFGSGVGWHLC
jgi:hypothetical protein